MSASRDEPASPGWVDWEGSRPLSRANVAITCRLAAAFAYRPVAGAGRAARGVRRAGRRRASRHGDEATFS